MTSQGFLTAIIQKKQLYRVGLLVTTNQMKLFGFKIADFTIFVTYKTYGPSP